MSENTLKIDNTEVNKKELHRSKQPTDLSLLDINETIIFEKFKHSNDAFKYIIGYKEDDIVKPLSIILLQMSGYIKCFENVEKICPS